MNLFGHGNLSRMAPVRHPKDCWRSNIETINDDGDSPVDPFPHLTEVGSRAVLAATVTCTRIAEIGKPPVMVTPEQAWGMPALAAAGIVARESFVQHVLTLLVRHRSRVTAPYS